MGMQITVKRLTGSIGAEVGGVSLNHPLDDVTFAIIHQALLAIACWYSAGSFLTP